MASNPNERSLEEQLFTLLGSNFKFSKETNISPNLSMIVGEHDPRFYYGASTQYTKESLSSDFPKLLPIFRAIEAATEKLKFTTPREEFRAKYVFCGKASRSINSTEASAVGWINQVLDELPREIGLPSRGPVVLTGSVGSGKSSFVKYLLVAHSSVFMRKKVIPSRIEYQRLMERFEKNPDPHRDQGVAWDENYTTCTLYYFARDVLYYLVVKGWLAEDGTESAEDKFTKSFAEFWKEVARRSKNMRSSFKNIFCIDRNLGLVREYFKASRERRPASHQIWALDKNFVSLLLLYASELGYVNLAIYDGFDAISPDDHVTYKHSIGTIHRMAKQAMKKEGLESLGVLSFNLPRHQIIVLRDSTYSYFSEEFSKAINAGRPRIYHLGPIGFDKILEHRTSMMIKIAHQDSNLDERLKELFLRAYLKLRNEISTHIGVDGGLEMIFNDNIRKCLDYFRTFLLYTFGYVLHERSFVLRDAQLGNLPNIFSFVLHYIDDVMQSKQYMFVRILIMNDSCYYHNALRLRSVVELNASECQRNNVFARNDAFSGFVDNIYNYHLIRDDFGAESSKSSQFPANSPPVLLFKVRILQILNATPDRGVSTVEILERLQRWFGYNTAGTKDVERALSVMVYSEMVTVTNFSRVISYRIQPHGRVVLERLCVSMAYVEQVCLKTNLPKFISDSISVDEIRSGLDASLEFYKACIANVFVFLQYVAFVEARESLNVDPSAAFERDRMLGTWRIYARMKDEFLESAQKIIKTEAYNHPEQHKIVISSLSKIRNAIKNLSLSRR